MSKPLILWTPEKKNDYQIAFESLEGLQKMFPEFSANSQYITDDIPLFRCRELGNFQLMQTFPGSKVASRLPVEISTHTRNSKKGNEVHRSLSSGSLNYLTMLCVGRMIGIIVVLI